MRALAYRRQTYPNLTVHDDLTALSPLPEPRRTRTFEQLCGALRTNDQPTAELLLDALLGTGRHLPGDLVKMATDLGCPSCGATRLVFQHPDLEAPAEAGVYRCNTIHAYGPISVTREYTAVRP
ncbi:hypothetical protein [Actinomadura rudentiformis]|uniref:Uncharacterized protein n=1 Tax=Actinomadura rudentiformis TaxID=359158 RepID=A0A6H9YI28_9ACTN|nr:hypothetical protein [Actinomadura rudentiformis]KAB2344857.1 hypothetical protein F8566_30155 [Actinomadura rudentiformis]